MALVLGWEETDLRFISIGFGSMVSAERLVAVVSPDSAPIKRLIQDRRERGSLIDASYGRRTQSVLVMDSDHIVLSSQRPEIILGRLKGGEAESGEGVEE